jgi:hypothetical protein
MFESDLEWFGPRETEALSLLPHMLCDAVVVCLGSPQLFSSIAARVIQVQCE